MLKEQRQDIIINEIEKKEIVKIPELKKILEVSEMTIRRDLNELESDGLLKRIHGGARSSKEIKIKEYSHLEKSALEIEQKKYIAKNISNIIIDGETVFLSPGTTIEFTSEFLKQKRCTIITNSLYLFNKIVDYPNLKVILIGGHCRTNTGAFVGPVANSMIKNLRFNRSFIGFNAISNGNVFTHNEEEGELAKLVLQNSEFKYICGDSKKIDKEDFYLFYNLSDADYLITSNNISEENKGELTNIIKLIC